MKTTHVFFTIFISFLTGIVMFSCSNDENGGSEPVITGVRLIDPEYADSTFTECYAGQSVVLVGKNLGSTYEIYVNDQKVSFQGTYVTDTHIIFTIPSDITLTGANPELKDEIRVVAKNGTAVYPFHINANGCSIISMKASFPLNSGDEIVLIGTNFLDIESIIYTNVEPGEDDNSSEKEWWEIEDEKNAQTRIGVTEVEEVEIEEYWMNSDFTELHLTLPAELFDEGWIIVNTRTNYQYVPVYKNASIPQISTVNSDMPIVGSKVKIYGNGFIGVISIGIGDNEINIPVSDTKISDDGTYIEFTMPEIPEKGGKLVVRTIAGESSIPFYDNSTLMFDLDERGGLNWGGATEVTGNGQTPPYVTSGKCAGVNATCPAGTTWWYEGRMALKDFVIPTSIPDETPISQLELRFEGYFMCKFLYTKFEVCFWENGIYLDYKPKSTFNNDIILNEWATYYIPISQVAGGANTYKELVDMMSWPELTLHAVSNSSDKDEDIQFYVDNVRLYVKPNK